MPFTILGVAMTVLKVPINSLLISLALHALKYQLAKQSQILLTLLLKKTGL